MKVFTHLDAPIKVFGVPFFEEKGAIRRLPEKLTQELEYSHNLGSRCPGARIGFRTDASSFEVEITFETMSVDIGMSIYSCQSAEVLVGERSKARFAGLVGPKAYDELTFSKKNKQERGA